MKESHFLRVNRLPGGVRSVLAPITRRVLGFHPWQNNSDFIPDWNWKAKETGEQERRIPLHHAAGYQLGLWLLAIILGQAELEDIEPEVSLSLEFYTTEMEAEDYDPDCEGWQLVIRRDPDVEDYIPLSWLKLSPDEQMPKILFSAIRIALAAVRQNLAQEAATQAEAPAQQAEAPAS